MTGYLTQQAAQARVDDMIRHAEHHRQAHAHQLDRLSGRWIPFRPRRPRAAIAPALVTHEPCN
jgi:hypothetical protein